MKTKTVVLTILLAALCAGLFFSCGVPVGLGSRLDVDGPLVEFTYVNQTAPPQPRQSVKAAFTIGGKASDFSGVDRLLVKASLDNVDFSKKWQWSKGSWEIFEDGAWRQYPDAEWEGTSREGTWKLPINMSVNGVTTDGQYVFSVQAWDTAEFSDDNSFRTLPLVIDQHPPSVNVSNPFLYPKLAYWYNSGIGDWEFREDPAETDPDPNWAEIKWLDGIDNNDDAERFDPANIGKFVTQGFLLQWQITDNEDIGRIELRLYKHNIDIDNEPLTPLPDNYIYSYGEDVVNLETVLPNGSVNVPRLTGVPGNHYDKGGRLENPLDYDTEKTTIRVVAICYDIAGNANEEKTLGFFVYWPLADKPWITFNGTMEGVDLGNFLGQPKNPDGVFMIYPGRPIKATAYQAHDAHRVEYFLYRVLETPTHLAAEHEAGTFPGYGVGECINSKSSTVLPWEFMPPPRSGYYVIKAKAYGAEGSDVEPSEEFASIFRVQDISFPDFFTSVRPAASESLFKFINRDNGDGTGDAPANTIRISGTLSDATNVTSLTMVWINPKSDNYAAMSQLAYFRDQDYHGWKNALTLSDNNGTSLENNTYAPNVPLPGTKGGYPYDPINPNRLWNLKVTTPLPPNDEDSGPGTGNTGRKLFTYSVDIDLDELNIGLDTDQYGNPTQDPLKSQMFLLRVANPDNKCTIITYAPQGDTLVPSLTITNVVINRSGTDDPPFFPNNAEQQMAKFEGGEVITVNGTWHEDSVAYLPIEAYFSDNMSVKISEIELALADVTVNQTNAGDTDGTWTATVTVTPNKNPNGTDTASGPGIIKASDLSDTFVVSAKVRDIGGNVAEVGSAWLIQSDTLRLVRISSDTPDGTVREGTTIRIFLEFNKAVQLTYENTTPTLTLNTILNGTANPSVSANATAVFDSAYQAKPTDEGGGGGVLNTRQYFTYTVGANHSTINYLPTISPYYDKKYLNVTGLSNPGAWDNSNIQYPFTWHRGEGDAREEIRVTNVSTHNGARPPNPGGGLYDFYAKKIPTSTTTTDTTEYPFTLFAGKYISVDTAAPTVESIIANNQPGYYGAGSSIYITVRFNEPVKKGTTIPRLTLAVNKTSGTAQTEIDPEPQVNGNDITFVYKVVSGDLAVIGTPSLITNGIVVTGHSGDITDLAGTPFSTTGISGITQVANRTLTGRYIDTLNPAPPTIRLLSANNIGNVVSNTVGVDGATRTGQVSTTAVDLTNVYNTSLWLAIQPSTNNVNGTGGETVKTLEYSINNGTTWVAAGNNANTPWALPDQPGQYNIRARQTDSAGNVSAQTSTLSFNWDKGNLVTRIRSSAANGTYTHVVGRNVIPITVEFRKQISVSVTTGITLNARNGSGGGTPITVNTVDGGLPRNNVTSLTFNYTVQNETTPGSGNGDRTPAGVWLDVTSLGTITATDGATIAQGTNISSNITMPASGSSLRLGENKQIAVESGSLTNTAPAFNANSSGFPAGSSSGIKDDGSYWTTLEIPFNHEIFKAATGEITIQQIAGSGDTAYRLPAVLTEAQYDRFRNIADFNTYYTRGTNGYINGQGSDTSAKYVMNYQYNPNSSVTGNDSAFNGDRPIPNAFFTAFRTTEKIVIDINAQAVEKSGSMLKIRLTGSNAPQVPGATYTVTYPAGLVTDSLGNTSAAGNYQTVVLDGVAKPFVRIKKTQDTISANTGEGSATTPRLTAAQPNYAYVRMDSRTPNSAIVYWDSTIGTGTVSAVNWNTTTAPTATTPTRPATSGTAKSYSPPLTGVDANGIRIGNTTHEGIKWWVVARASSGGVNSFESDEMAYRTAITYRLRDIAMEDTTGQQTIGDGDQIWIRGGDAIGSTSIPGFPLTWDDDFYSLQATAGNGKRAGIRLMTKTNTTDNLTNSTWQLLTWDINATAYIDIILGRDKGYTHNAAGYNQRFEQSLNVNEAWQYGPRYWALQRSGWSSQKAFFPIFPGEIRYLDTNANKATGVNMNFSAAFKTRPSAGTTPTTGWGNVGANGVTYPTASLNTN